jgi:nucleoside-diphosphate-sugar epimerase
VHDPSIWRPIISIQDACSAYIRAIEANERLSGIFNVASGNYTVGEAADQVKTEIEEQLGTKIKLNIKHIRDMRNYKVSFEKAKNVLSFHPHHDIRSIVHNLIEQVDKFSDWNNPLYYNILTFQALEAKELARTAAA